MPKKGADSRRDYQKYRDYYIDRETSPQGIKKRVQRDQSRRAAIEAGMLKGKNDPRTVDHKKPLSKGGGAGLGNLQIMSGTANRRKYD